MKIEVEINGQPVIVTCPFCATPEPPAPPLPDPVLIETGRFICPQCKRDFVAMNVGEYAEAIVESRPALLVGEILKRL